MWRHANPEVELVISPWHSRTVGLLDGTSDMGILKYAVDDRRLHGAVVGLEARYACLPGDHALAGARSLILEDLDGCTIAIDPLTGTTTHALWPDGNGPSATLRKLDIEKRVATFVDGRAIGITSAAIAWQHPRSGIGYRPVAGVAPIAVSPAWRVSYPPALAPSLVSLVAAPNHARA